MPTVSSVLSLIGDPGLFERNSLVSVENNVDKNITPWHIIPDDESSEKNVLWRFKHRDTLNALLEGEKTKQNQNGFGDHPLTPLQDTSEVLFLDR